MELQYAIFCADVEVPLNEDTPIKANSFILTYPIPHLTVQAGETWRLPLFVTFINCDSGDRKFTIEISDFDGGIIAVRDYRLNFITPAINYFHSVLVEVPIHRTDLLTFKMFLDGIQQETVIKLPVKVEG